MSRMAEEKVPESVISWSKEGWDDGWLMLNEDKEVKVRQQMVENSKQYMN